MPRAALTTAADGQVCDTVDGVVPAELDGPVVCVDVVEPVEGFDDEVLLAEGLDELQLASNGSTANPSTIPIGEKLRLDVIGRNGTGHVS